MVKKILVSLALSSILLSTNAMACPSKNNTKTCNYHATQSTVSKVVRAVSKTGLSAAQTVKIAEGIAAYEAKAQEIKKMKIFPIDSFINEEFDEKKFIAEMSEKYITAVAARATLFKYVFSVLDKEQRKIFKREYAAPLIKRIIRSY